MKEILEKYLGAISKIGGDCRPLIFENAASEKDVLAVERKLGYSLPEAFRNILLTVSSHCDFKWFLPRDFSLPDHLDGIFSGELYWNLDMVLEMNKDKDEWIREVFPNADEEYDRVWHNKFVFLKAGNSDFISIDLAPENAGKIVYLSHDDGDGHGVVMANNFYDLLRNWSKLGCVGAEDWQWLPFCRDKTSGMDPECENARLWYEIIGIA